MSYLLAQLRAYQEQLKDWFKEEWVEILDVGGCAANDGWALTALAFWAADDVRGAALRGGDDRQTVGGGLKGEGGQDEGYDAVTAG